LDARKLILIAFLFRFILASGYDIFVSVTDRDVLLPDAKFYSTKGRYITFLLNGYDEKSFTENMIPRSSESKGIFFEILAKEKGQYLSPFSQVGFYSYVVGIIYFIFGYFPLAVRVFNIILSLSSIYFFFKIGEWYFGRITANLFLLIALFLPTQLVYSITFSKDLLRMFVISLIIFTLYGGALWLKKRKKYFCFCNR